MRAMKNISESSFLNDMKCSVVMSFSSQLDYNIYLQILKCKVSENARTKYQQLFVISII